MPKKQSVTVGEDTDVVIGGKMLRDKIYTIRGQKVMLDYDLAKIYGYTTSAFNQQVARNMEKFEGEEFMFQLTKNDLENLSISRNVISMQTKGVKGGRAKMPYAFTEQGIYMLMTVLRGPLAVRQSRALVMLFKKMKDYVLENHELMEQREQLKTMMMVLENNKKVAEIEKEVIDVDKRLATVEGSAGEMVMRSEISPILLDFNKMVEQKEFIFLDGQPVRAGELYVDLYGKAKKSVYVIDNYVSIKTLRHLIAVKPGVEVVIFSDNLGKYLGEGDLADFERECPGAKVQMVKTSGRVHDRFIILDYGEENEEIYHCGTSEKDAGRKMTMISKLGGGLTKELVDEMVERLRSGSD